ncbi:hypothetical protein [Flavobacterium sp.]|uniref:hypothetical protein n=1 Tax=Flavobacterium sp. TaxID=239 RepID=UPI0037518084
MSERKNINHLFQEKFENHEVIPQEIVWKNIEIKLKEKKKRRVIPIWWRLSGSAAALLIGFFVYNNYFNANPNNEVVTRDEKSSETKTNTIIKSTEYSNKTTTPSSTNNSSAVANKEENKEVTNENLVHNEQINHDKINESIEYKKPHNNEIVVKLELKKAINGKTITGKDANNSKVYKNQSTDENIVYNDLTLIDNKEIATVIENKIKTKENIITSSFYKEIVNNLENNTVVLNPNLKIDSIKIAVVEPNALEELQKEKEKKIITEQKLNRWQVSSNLAPIYFSSTTNGSPLDKRLESNNKNYATNIGYGLGIKYSLNKKIKLRSGINIVSVNYETNGIAFYQNTSGTSKITNLNPNNAGAYIEIENLDNVNTSFNKIQQHFEGKINQKLGYIEVPVEISYLILNKKIGINIIGGLSSLLLNENEIFLKSEGLNLKIGEASNLNNIHFSGNLGLGFKYGFFKHLEANLEPVFKYQINTFSSDAGNFKPFVFGVYSGLSFTF